MADLASTRVFGKLTVMHEAIVKANAEIAGNITASKFIGDGSQLTALPWGQLTGVPSTFAPSSHTHPWGEVTGAPATATRWPSWSEVSSKPSTFTPSAHTHSLSEVTDAGDLAALNTNASTTNFLRGDGTWATPPNTNTTYSEITTAEIDAGTASTLRTISGRRMKYALDKKSDTGHGHAIGDVTGLQAALDSKANTSTQVIAGTGLTGGGSLAANRTLSVTYGTTAGTAAEGNDSRLTNAREWTATAISQAEAEAGTATTARKWTSQRVRQAILGWWSDSAEKSKLDGIQAGATANATNAQLRNRATHTGTQAISTVAGLQASLDALGSISGLKIGDRLLSSQPSRAGYVEADQIYQVAEYPDLFGVVGQMEPQEFPNARRTDLFEGGDVTDVNDAYATEDGTVIAVACSVAPGIRVFRWDAGSGVFRPVSLTGSIPAQLPTAVTGTPDGEYLVFSYSGSPRLVLLKRDGLSYAHMQSLSTVPINGNPGYTSISADGQYICTSFTTSDSEGRERVWRRQGSEWSLLPAVSELGGVSGWKITGDGKRIFSSSTGSNSVGYQLTVDGNVLKDLSEFDVGASIAGQLAADYAGQLFLVGQGFVRYDPTTNGFSYVPVASHSTSTSVFDNRGVAWTFSYSGSRGLHKRLFEDTTEYSHETPVIVGIVSGASSPHVYSAAARSLIAFYLAETTGYMDYPYDPVTEFYIPESVPEQLSALNFRVSTPVKEFVKAE